jgi:hypothetical protein
MAKVNPISDELEKLADDLYTRFPGVVLGVLLPGGNGKTRVRVFARGEDSAHFWIAHKVWHNAPDPPTTDDA